MKYLKRCLAHSKPPIKCYIMPLFINSKRDFTDIHKRHPNNQYIDKIMLTFIKIQANTK